MPLNYFADARLEDVLREKIIPRLNCRQRACLFATDKRNRTLVHVMPHDAICEQVHAARLLYGFRHGLTPDATVLDEALVMGDLGRLACLVNEVPEGERVVFNATYVLGAAHVGHFAVIDYLINLARGAFVRCEGSERFNLVQDVNYPSSLLHVVATTGCAGLFKVMSEIGVRGRGSGVVDGYAPYYWRDADGLTPLMRSAVAGCSDGFDAFYKMFQRTGGMRTWAMLALQRCEGVPFGGMNLAHLVAHNNAGEDRSDASLRAKQKAFIAHCLMAQFPAGSLLAWSAADNKIHHHVDDLGNTPLMTALTHGHAKVAVVILAVVSTSLTRQDAYFAQRNVDGHTALDLAVLHHHAHPGCLEEVCRFMQTEDVELGIRAMDPACGDHFTPLAVAVAHGSRRAAKILLQSLAKMYLTQYGNKLGRRAMMRCVTRRDADEHSALSIATEASDVRMVALLKSFYK